MNTSAASVQKKSHKQSGIRRMIIKISRKFSLIVSFRPRARVSHLLAMMLTAAASPALALPTGGQVVSGDVNVAQPSDTSLTITQATNKGVINWDSYSIYGNETVTYLQPSTSSVTLNRVTGGDASEILGQIVANGQIFLINPNGVLFGRDARIDVGGLVASTLDIGDDDFLAGRYILRNGGNAGSVVNQGSLAGKYVALVAPTVDNSGTITANGGTVALAAGDRVNLDISGDSLVQVSVDSAAAGASISHSGAIVADGGKVYITAKSADALMDTVLNVSGLVRARSLSEQNGTIVLDGGEAGVVSVTGTLDASGKGAGETGGSIAVLGDKVGLFAGANIDASGDAGGGTVLVGGNFQGNGPERNASMTYVADGARIDASAIGNGDGGTVIVWSNEATRYYGSIVARGGSLGGDGGFVEVSGKQSLVFAGQFDARAPMGVAGTLLLDPDTMTICSFAAGTCEDGANLGTSPFASNDTNPSTVTWQTLDQALTGGTVTVQTSTGDIVIQDGYDFSADNTGSGGRNDAATGTLVLDSGANITSTASAITGRSGLNLTFQSVGTTEFATDLANFSAITFNNGADSIYSGVISGAGSLTKSGTAILTLTGANSYDGLTTVSAGTLVAENSSALGSTAAGTTVASGATLAIYGVDIGAEALTLSGTGVGGAGALYGYNTAASSGSVTLAANTAIGVSNASSLTLSGVVAESGGARTLTKLGLGTLTLSGANTYTGLTTVSEGTLVAASSAALGTTAAGTTVASGATLHISGVDIGAEALTLNGTGVGGIGALYGTGTAASSGGVTLNTDATIGVGTGGSLTLSGVVTESNGGAKDLTKVGNGTLTLSGANDYTGLTTISAGTLVADNDAALGDTGGNTLVNGGTLSIADGITIGAGETITLSGGSLAGSGTSEVQGDVVLTTASTITANSGATFTISGDVSGANTSYDLTKDGAGTLVLSGNNSYQGTTGVSAGTLVAADNNALGSAVRGTNVDSGATLVIDGVDVPEGILVNSGATLALKGTTPTVALQVTLNGTLDYSAYSGTGITFGLAGTATGLLLGWTGTPEAVVGSASANDKVTGSGETYNLTGANAGNNGTVYWTSIENLQDSGAATFNMHVGADGSVDGSLTASGGTVDYTGYTTAVSFDLNGGTSTGMAGWTGITSVTGSSNSDTVTGSGDTYNLTGADEGNNGTVYWTSFENLADDGAATFNMHVGADGSVSGTLTAVGGAVDYTDYTTAVSFDLAGGASTGMAGWSGITSVTGSAATTDTILGTDATYNLTGLDAGNDGTVYWTSMEVIADAGTGTISTTGGQTFDLTGANQGTVGLLTGGFSGIGNLEDTGAATFNMGTAGSVSGDLTAVGGTVNYASYATAVNFDLSGGASTGMATWSGITSVTGSANSDTIAGTDETYNLTGLDAGNDGTVYWTSMEVIADAGTGTISTTGGQTFDLTGADQGTVGLLTGGFSGIGNLEDTGAATFNMGTAGSVSGDLTAVGGTVNYASYATAVNFDLGGGASTGMATWSGITTVTGSANSDTMNGSGETWNMTAANAGNNGTVSWTSFENLHDAGNGTFNGSGGSISGALTNTGSANLSGTIGAGTVAIDGPVTLVGNTTVSATTIGFGDTVDSDGTARTLVVNGTTTFDGDVGAGSKLASLQVNGAATLNGASVNTTGNQLFYGNLTVPGDIAFNSDNGAIYAYYGGNDFGGTVSASSGSASEWIDIETSGNLSIGTINSNGSVVLWASNNLSLGTVTAQNAYLYAGSMTNANLLPTDPNLVVPGNVYLYSLGGDIGTGAITLSGGTQISQPNNGIRFTSTLPAYLWVYPSSGQAALTVDNAGDISPLVQASSASYLNNIWECTSSGCTNLGTGAVANAAASTLSGILNAAAQDLFNSTFGTDNIRVAIQNGFLTQFGVVPPGIDAIEGDGARVPGASLALVIDPPPLLIDEEELKRRSAPK